jgi:hypothetical protein
VLRVGFTGTRRGMTEAQSRAAWQALCDLIGGDTQLLVEVHHGECVGADAQFHKHAVELGARIIGHPCTLVGLRADLTVHESREPKAPLMRNHDIVNETKVLIAAPHELYLQPRGGTWATYRLARRLNHHVILVRPDGVVQETNAPRD